MTQEEKGPYGSDCPETPFLRFANAKRELYNNTLPNDPKLLQHIHSSWFSKFACTKCNKNFSSTSSLRKHEKYTHVDKKPTEQGGFQCQQCCKTFIHSRTLRHHVRHAHLDPLEVSEPLETLENEPNV